MSNKLRGYAVIGTAVVGISLGLTPSADAVATTAVAAAKVKPSISVTASNTTPDVGTKVVVSIATKGVPAKAAVTVQELSGKKWINRATVKTDRRGRAVYSVAITRGGVGQYRAIGKVGRVSLASTALKVTGYRWMPLALKDALGSVGKVSAEVTQNGKTSTGWSSSLADTTEDTSLALTGWDLDGTCTSFRGTAFTESAAGPFFVFAGKDEKSVVGVEVSKGAPKALKTDLRGARELVVGAVIDKGAGVVNIAAPQVRCPWR